MSEDFEFQTINEIRYTLEQAVKGKAAELRDKHGVERFVDLDLGIKCENDNQLFSYLARRKNIMDDADIDIYLASVLIKYAESTANSFKGLDDEEYGKNLAGKLLDEAEASLQKPSLNPFGRAYQTYLLGCIEFERVMLINGEENQETEKRIGSHYRKIIKFLEESRYYSMEIDDARDLLISAYDVLHNHYSSPEEKPRLKKRFDELNAENPEHMGDIEAILAQIEGMASQPK